MLRQAEDFKARRPQVLPGARHAITLKVSPNLSDHEPCITRTNTFRFVVISIRNTS